MRTYPEIPAKPADSDSNVARYSDGGKYAMLITCGDKYENNSNATSKLYVLLKARS